MTKKDLPKEVEALLSAHPEIDSVDLIVSDMNGILRGKRTHINDLAKVFSSGINLPAATHFLDVKGNVIETISEGAHDGDPDVFCRPVEGTLKQTPWARRPTAQVLLTMYEQDGSPYFGDPRHVLGRAYQFLTDQGLSVVMAVELEFYLLDAQAVPPIPAPPSETSAPLTGPQVYNFDAIDDFDKVLTEIDEACRAQDIPASAAGSEYGQGQFEINLHHIGDPQIACDQATLLKRVVKGVAKKHGLLATFMAKPFQMHPGSGMHIHASVLNKDGDNIFAEDHATDGKSDFLDTLTHAVGGLADTMAESMAIFAPNANSYRRFSPGFFAPVEPNWGPNHRSVSLRIPLSDAKNRRVEHRVAGADANPYLVTAAVIAGLHHGLTQKRTPPPMRQQGEVFEPEVLLPTRWEKALDVFEESTILPKYLGERYADLFAKSRRFECNCFHAEISDRDFDWYLRAF